MAKGRSKRARRRPKRRRAARTRSAPRPSTLSRTPSAPDTVSAISEAEAALLALARELAAPPAASSLAAALQRLAGAHAPDAPLPRAVARAWIEGRQNKTAALQLAWAREQVRLALEEILTRATARGRLTGPADTRAWLLLAAAESIAQEPEAAAADRVKTLLELGGA
jgi:hypothetical protein